MKKITGKKVVILTEDGFEEIELTSPKQALEEAGVQVHIISPQQEKVKAWDNDHWSQELPVDTPLDNASPADYDALVLPGGVMNPDKLRTSAEAVKFVDAFLEAGKPVAAICHGPQVLIETGKLQGVKMTSYPSLQTDLRNAGASWEDSEMVYDQGLITSRSPKDLEAFNNQLLKVLEEQTSEHASIEGDGLQFPYSQSMQ